MFALPCSTSNAWAWSSWKFEARHRSDKA